MNALASFSDYLLLLYQFYVTDLESSKFLEILVIQKPSMGPCTQRDEPLVCSASDQVYGASPCKVGSLIEIQTAATQKPATSVRRWRVARGTAPS
jgi:hypothetical protein